MVLGSSVEVDAVVVALECELGELVVVVLVAISVEHIEGLFSDIDLLQQTSSVASLLN